MCVCVVSLFKTCSWCCAARSLQTSQEDSADRLLWPAAQRAAIAEPRRACLAEAPVAAREDHVRLRMLQTGDAERLVVRFRRGHCGSRHGWCMQIFRRARPFSSVHRHLMCAACSLSYAREANLDRSLETWASPSQWSHPCNRLARLFSGACADLDDPVDDGRWRQLWSKLWSLSGTLSKR